MMRKIKIRLPATVTNLGPGINSLGLALGLYATVEISAREDDEIMLEFQGEGAGRFSSALSNPVVLGIGRFFQHLERSHPGITIRVVNQIPLSSGLGAEAALMIAGIIGANDIMERPYDRLELLELAARISRADHAVTAIMGGLTASLLNEDTLIHHVIPINPVEVIVVVPELAGYIRPAPVDQVPLSDALYNLGRLPLVVEAFRAGDLDLLAQVLEDRLVAPRIIPNISGYDYVADIARRAGIKAVAVAGSGPALIAFVEARHEHLSEEMRLAFQSAGITARTWVVPVDRQGVVISAVQSA